MNGLPISPVGPVTATVSMGRFWRNRGPGGAQSRAVQSDAHVDDLDQALKAAQVLGVSRVEGQVVREGRGGDHQVDRTPAAWLAAVAVNSRVDRSVGARAGWIEG